MNWVECSKFRESLGESRFSWPANGWADFNCQEGVTLSDVTGGLRWLWTYPGDWLLRLPGLNRFFELESDYTGGFAGALIIVWLVIGIAFAGTFWMGKRNDKSK